MIKKWNQFIRGVTAVFLTGFLAACTAITGAAESASSETSSEVSEMTSTEETVSEGTSQSSGEYDLTFSSSDLETGYEEESVTTIQLGDGNSSIDGEGAAVEDDIITITAGGDYLIEGTLSDGQVVVSVADTEKVHIILNGVDMTSSTSAPISITEADKVWITLNEGSENYLTDAEGSTDTIGSGEDSSTIDGTIYSKADLAFNGAGELTIQANTKHGIVSKDDLIITSGTYNITANGQGLSGKDAVKIKEGTFTLTTQKDAIQSDNAEDAGRGFVYIESGTFFIESQGDAIQAETLLQVTGGTFEVVTAGGSENGVDHTETMGPFDNFETNTEETETEETPSTKGLKAGNELIINGGEFVFDTADDSIHSNGTITLSGGSIIADTGDDGIHADSDLLLNRADITIINSYEGIEGSTITVDAGNIQVTASDDGFNVAGGNDGSSLDRPGANPFESNDENQLIINGGTIVVDAQGDGLDSNGTTTINGGDIIVSGPENSGNGTLDSGGGTTIKGGTIVGAGSSGMAEGFASDSTQANVLYNLDSTYAAGTLVEVKSTDGTVLLSWTAAKSFSSLIFSSEDLVVGETYVIAIDGTEIELTLEDMVTSNGSGMGMGGMQPGGMNGMPGGQGGRPDEGMPEYFNE